MNPQGAFSIRLERSDSFKSRRLVYEEPGFALSVYLEMSGVREFDWVGCDTEFSQWTSPANAPIQAEKQNQIRERIRDWSREKRLRIDFGPHMDMEAYFAEQQARGCTVERLPDGSTRVTPPPHQGLFSRLARLLSFQKGN